MATVVSPADTPAVATSADDVVRYRRAVRWALVLLGLGGAIAAICRSGLSWDGSYILFTTLHEQHPFITHGRLTSNLVLWPVVGLSAVTSNLTVLAIAFTAVWAAVPVLALGLCWLVVRDRRPDLIRWPALGICLVTLPGQFFFASEALAAAQLFWVVLMWICVDLPWRWLPGAVLLAVAVGLFHPAGGGLLLVGGAAAAVFAVCRSESRLPQGMCALVLVAAGLIRMAAIEPTGYEGDSFRWEVLGDHYDTAVKGAPLVALLALTLVLVGFVLRRRADLLVGVGLVVAGGAFLVWASQPQWWSQELNYRSWGPLISAGVMGCCALATAARSASAVRPAARPLIVPMAAVYAGVIVVQSLLWRGELVRLQDALPTPVGCRPAGEIFRPDLPIEHWAVGATGLLLQDRAPRGLVLYADVHCSDFTGPRLPLAPYENSARTGWFDLSGLGVGGTAG